MRILNYYLIASLLTFISTFTFAQSYMAGGRVHLPPIPKTVAGIKNITQSLDGAWEINLNPNPQSTKDISQNHDWQSIQVPGEPMMQGFKIKNDTAFVYRKKLNITEDTKDKKHFIRFNGVYNHAIVYCNGQKVREHFGGFTAWDADITKIIKPGQDNWLHVAVTERADDISYASGYAHHPIGGILRKVQYLVLPDKTVDYVYVNAGLTNQYKDGTLAIRLAMPVSNSVSVVYDLADASGKKLITKPRSLTVGANNIWQDSTNISSVKAWTAEAPSLYTLRLQVLENGKQLQTIVQKIGFRTVEIDAQKQFLVNGKSVKLRGACRHDMNPLLGRSTNRAQDSLDVVIAKESNMNFIRTSHYPPSDDFLEFCDHYGIYVQEETAICFVIDWREGIYKQYGESQDNPAFTDRYLGQLSEMIDRDRNHASVIMWSIGNESRYGMNFQKSYDFVKSIDFTRPVSWSWPNTALDKGKRCFDIGVSHYPIYNGKGSDMGGFEKNMVHPDYPVLGDEWAHVACYNTEQIGYDPNVKDFWGKSMDTMWLNRFDVAGNIGGAIWGMIDEMFYLKDTITGYGPWGIVDVWRRKKPEFWNTKKAYSPIRLNIADVKAENGKISIPVHNRFDHTNLKDVNASIIVNGKSIKISLPDIAPHKKGSINIASNADVLIQFKDSQGNLLDEEKISIAKTNKEPSLLPEGAAWVVTQKDSVTQLSSGRITFAINNRSGAILSGKSNGQSVITGNPLVVVNKPKEPSALKNVPGIFSGKYIIQSAQVDQNDKTVYKITTKGMVDNYPVQIITSLRSNGSIEINYTADSIPAYTWDIGVSVPVNNQFDKIDWNRKGYWTTYPKGHISGNEGTILKTNNSPEQYRVMPIYDVTNAMYDYYINKTIVPQNAKMLTTEGFRGKKENIYHYTISGKTGKLSALSDGTQAASMFVKKEGSQHLLVTDKWDYWNLSWGNYEGAKNTSKQFKGTVFLQL